MASARKPFQGTLNIIAFNRGLYISGIIFYLAAFLFSTFTTGLISTISLIASISGILTILIGLITSLYIYDLSGLYQFPFLKNKFDGKARIANINAGFDETSAVIKQQFPTIELSVFDFFDEKRNTEISLQRARKMYPAYAGTTIVPFNHFPVSDNYFDAVLLLFAAHEIRTDEEKNQFFGELHRITKTGGKIIMAEHLRDLPNMLAYNIGALHFFSLSTWKNVAQQQGWHLTHLETHTPFIHIFTFTKNGYAH